MTEPLHPELATTREGWLQRMIAMPRVGGQVAVLIDMVEAHCPTGNYWPHNVNGRCAGLLKKAKDPLRACEILYRAIHSGSRTGDPVQYAMGMLRFAASERTRVGDGGGGPETASAAQWLEAFGATGTTVA